MAMTYTVKLVSPTEFEAIARSSPRYAHVLDEDNPSVAFTDTRTRQVVVPMTHSTALNRELLTHELEHVIERHGTHEDEYGVRHKKVLRSWAKASEKLTPEWAKSVPVIGPAFQVQQDWAQGNKVGAGSIVNAIAQPALAAFGVGNLAAAGAQNSVNAATATKALAPTTPGVGGGQVASKLSMQQFGVNSLVNPGRTPPTVPGSPVPPPGGGGGGGGFLSNLMSGGKNLLGFGQGSGTASGGGGGAFDLGKLGIGAALTGFGQAAAPKVETPSFNTPSVQHLRDTAGQPQSELGRLGQTRLSERLTQTQPTLDSAIESDIRRRFQQEKDAVTSQFKVFRPGANLAEDSAFRQAMADVADREATTLAQAKQAEIDNFRTRQAADISQALGVDTQTLETMTQLAQLDIEEIMLRTGMQAQQASEFKQQFGRLAELFVASGLGMNQNPMAMFGTGR